MTVTTNWTLNESAPVFIILQVSFQATIGRNYSGGIAVDDVTLTNGLCQDESEPQNNRQGINLNSNFNFVGVRWLMISVLASGTSGPGLSSCRGVMLCSRAGTGV